MYYITDDQGKIMKVENVYQDEQGDWHIDYGLGNLMGLAIRVYFGELLIGIIFGILLIMIIFFAGFTLGKSLPKENKTPLPANF